MLNEKLKGKSLEVYKKTLKFTTIQKQIIIGTLLGDASIPKQKNKKTYNIKFEQKLLNKEYINHLYFIFKDFVGTEPKIRNIKGGNAQDRQSFWFRTYKHNSINYYYHLFYNGGKKKVPKNIKKLMGPRILAYWFMDDGSKVKSGYKISTHSFSLEDNKLLVESLKKLNLNPFIYKDKNYYYLYFYSSDILNFTNLVKPFILKSMLYKLHNI